MINHLLLLSFISLFLGCQNKKVNDNFILPERNEINDVFQAVIYQDSLITLTENQSSDSFQNIPISIDLRKIKILIGDNSDIPPPPPFNEVYIDQLLSKEINEKRIFMANDSLFLLYQDSMLKTIRIDDQITSSFLTTTLTEQQNRLMQKNHIRFYDLSIPYFSKDLQSAYIEVTFNCSGLCGWSTALYLKKIGGKWKIIEKDQLWIS